MSHESPTIAIIGAGPIGLESALYARFLGYDVNLYEREEVGNHIMQWGHVHFFTPFGINHSPLSVAALNAQNPDCKLPSDQERLTGREYVDRFLKPLAQTDLLSRSLYLHTEVVSIGRADFSKTDFGRQYDRGNSRFRLLLRDNKGKDSISEADIVIDATGVYGQHRFLGRGGLPAVGEQAMSRAINYRLPQITNSAASPFAGRHTLVVGAGYSAATSICALADLAESVPDTRITWVVRNPRGKNGPLQHIPKDPLAHRAALTAAANQWADCGERVHYLPGKNIDSICRKDEQNAFEVVLGGQHEGEDVMSLACDFILGHTGFRPDCTIFNELQVQLCYVTEGPIRLAAHLLQEQGGDCLNQKLPTEDLLTTSEPDFFILGNKSYGRDPNFLLSLGLEQIRQLYCQISGDPTLNLYESIQRSVS